MVEEPIKIRFHKGVFIADKMWKQWSHYYWEIVSFVCSWGIWRILCLEYLSSHLSVLSIIFRGDGMGHLSGQCVQGRVQGGRQRLYYRTSSFIQPAGSKWRLEHNQFLRVWTERWAVWENASQRWIHAGWVIVRRLGLSEKHLWIRVSGAVNQSYA